MHKNRQSAASALQSLASILQGCSSWRSARSSCQLLLFWQALSWLSQSFLRSVVRIFVRRYAWTPSRSIEQSVHCCLCISLTDFPLPPLKICACCMINFESKRTSVDLRDFGRIRHCQYRDTCKFERCMRFRASWSSKSEAGTEVMLHLMLVSRA